MPRFSWWVKGKRCVYCTFMTLKIESQNRCLCLFTERESISLSLLCLLLTPAHHCEGLPWLVRRGGTSALPVITCCPPRALAGRLFCWGLLGRREVLNQGSSGSCYIVSEPIQPSKAQGAVQYGVSTLQLQNYLFGLWWGSCLNGHHSDIILQVSCTRHLSQAGTGFPPSKFLAWLLPSTSA